ncbi:beta-ketothiolase BktB [Patulibacter brassicae]|uniref:Probable acetyl-CoA acetyltransferase n=1 Tax=Patulibacter brassicae TaxID=1705717 RepID=A0ABU4VM85_9ACTN|nr:beta-ketothiolase BktB [Patulibacter brassicae]MDX8152938.1 beta-ketothiolase BktB [Patulibacter brassicae]
MTGVVIASAARTAIGSYSKSLKDVPATQLGITAAKAAIERAGLQPEQIEHTVYGNVIHTDTDDMYMARVVSIGAGVPQESPSLTVNRLCGSGVQSIVTATMHIQTGDVDVALAGGAESMSQAPYWVSNARWGAKMGPSPMVDPVVGGLTDPFRKIHMGVTAENLSVRDTISRGDQDAFAFASHQKAAAARAAGKFAEEITPVVIKGRKGDVSFDTDEHIREDISLEALAKLKPAFKREDGTVTAGNASGLNDAGAAVTLLSEAKAAELGITPKAKILGYAVTGVDPNIMGIGPVTAIRKVLDRTGVALDDIAVIELNEAFAAQSLAVTRELGLADDDPRVNPNGGAIALGHPIGASGTIVTIKALSELHRTGAQYGLISLCIGGGQGIALLIERV